MFIANNSRYDLTMQPAPCLHLEFRQIENQNNVIIHRKKNSVPISLTRRFTRICEISMSTVQSFV